MPAARCFALPSTDSVLNFARFFEDLPTVARQTRERLVVSLGCSAFASDIPDQDAADPGGVLAGQRAVNLRVLFARVTHEHKLALRKSAQQRLDDARFVTLGRRKQTQNT